jgi:hypothetical protein
MPTPKRPNPWNPKTPLILGLCFGLAFGVTGRLLDGRFANLVRLGERFEVKSFPGVGLESLRMRYGLDRVDVLAEPPIAPELPPVMPGL